MSKSTHQIAVTGVDNTAKTFKSIQARAIATGNKIASVMGGAIAAAGAYLSFRSIKTGIEELAHLSDVAQRAGTSAGELRQLSQALNILGIQGADIDSLSKSLAMMAKDTGRTGLQGFYDTIAEIGKIPDVAERSQAAIRAFGRSGLELMPLINAADESTSALEGVVGAIHKLKDEHAAAADDIADGVAIVTGDVKDLWLEALGSVAQALTGNFGNSFRQTFAALGAYIRYWAHNAGDILSWPFRKLQTLFESLYGMYGALAGGAWEKLFGTGGNWSDVFGNAGKAFTDAWARSTIDDEDMEARMAARAEALARELDAISKLQENYDKAAKGTAGTEPTANATETGNKIAEAVTKAVKVSNDLIYGGSNHARKLSVFGPQYQNEQKKQTEVLKKIEKNTAKTATEIADGETTYESTNLGV